MPDYLRTKLDLDLERQQQEMEAEGDKLTPEAAKVQFSESTKLESVVCTFLVADQSTE